jgi:hypothetical protein
LGEVPELSSGEALFLYLPFLGGLVVKERELPLDKCSAVFFQRGGKWGQ